MEVNRDYVDKVESNVKNINNQFSRVESEFKLKDIELEERLSDYIEKQNQIISELEGKVSQLENNQQNQNLNVEPKNEPDIKENNKASQD